MPYFVVGIGSFDVFSCYPCMILSNLLANPRVRMWTWMQFD